MDIRELYQQHYFHEMERRDQINNSLVIPLGVISVVSGAFLVVAKEIDAPFDYSEKFQLVFLVLTALALISSATFLVRAYWGYGYAHMPRPGELRKYREGLLNHYSGSGKSFDEAVKIVDEETLQYVESQYAANAETNAENNDKKSANLFIANGLTIASVVLLVISAIPYVLNSIRQPNEVQKLEIINLQELKMSDQNKQPTQNQQPPAPPPKPNPPPSRVIREHVEPPAKK